MVTQRTAAERNGSQLTPASFICSFSNKSNTFPTMSHNESQCVALVVYFLFYFPFPLSSFLFLSEEDVSV